MFYAACSVPCGPSRSGGGRDRLLSSVFMVAPMNRLVGQVVLVGLAADGRLAYLSARGATDSVRPG